MSEPTNKRISQKFQGIILCGIEGVVQAISAVNNYSLVNIGNTLKPASTIGTQPR